MDSRGICGVGPRVSYDALSVKTAPSVSCLGTEHYDFRSNGPSAATWFGPVFEAMHCRSESLLARFRLVYHDRSVYSLESPVGEQLPQPSDLQLFVSVQRGTGDISGSWCVNMRGSAGGDELKSDDKGGTMMGVMWSLTVLALLIVVTRLYTRQRLLRNLGLDDWLIVASMVTSLLP